MMAYATRRLLEDMRLVHLSHVVFAFRSVHAIFGIDHVFISIFRPISCPALAPLVNHKPDFAADLVDILLFGTAFVTSHGRLIGRLMRTT